jgi:RimJ/RimL family protein N-acetyltransferase
LPLSWSFATVERDANDFAHFQCWNGDPGLPWVEEAENYVRAWVLRRSENVLAFRDEGGALVAVSAFDPRVILVPIVNPVEHPGWHLQVVAIRLDQQGHGLSREIFTGTFAAMKSVDPNRVLYTANVHKDNRPSLRAGAAVGLLQFRRKDAFYLELLGEVPP